jgi:hypothetical protein
MFRKVSDDEAKIGGLTHSAAVRAHQLVEAQGNLRKAREWLADVRAAKLGRDPPPALLRKEQDAILAVVGLISFSVGR